MRLEQSVQTCCHSSPTFLMKDAHRHMPVTHTFHNSVTKPLHMLCKEISYYLHDQANLTFR